MRYYIINYYFQINNFIKLKQVYDKSIYNICYLITYLFEISHIYLSSNIQTSNVAVFLCTRSMMEIVNKSVSH